MELIAVVPFVVGLIVPQRWYWWIGVAVGFGLACGFLVRGAPDVDPGTAAIIGVVAFGVAVVGVALAALVRWAFARKGRQRQA